MATRKQKAIAEAEDMSLPITANMTAADIEELIADAKSSAGDIQDAVEAATGDADTSPPPAPDPTPDPKPVARRGGGKAGRKTTTAYRALCNVKAASPGDIVHLTKVEAAPLLNMVPPVLEAP